MATTGGIVVRERSFRVSVVAQEASDFRLYTLTTEGPGGRSVACTPEAIFKRSRVWIFGGVRDAKSGYGCLNVHLDLMREWHRLGGALIFLADSLPIDQATGWTYFAQQAGVNPAARRGAVERGRATLEQPVGRLEAGYSFPIAATVCADGWADGAPVVARTLTGQPYCVCGNRVAFVEIGGLAQDGVEPVLTEEEREFLVQLVFDMGAEGAEHADARANQGGK
jgi:hypothetical protein